MPERKYPGADRSQWLPQFSGIRMKRIRKIVLHSTESGGWPGYPSFAPQLTVDLFDKKIRQHMDLDMSASTLSDPSHTQVRENRDDVLQIEIVMYCDHKKTGQRKHVTKMGDEEYEFLSNILRWVHQEWGVPLEASVEWVAYPDSYGYRAPQRLSGVEYDDYQGILGHQHVSGNDHGDPGKINIKKLLELARSGLTPSPQPQPEGFDMSAARKIYYKRNADQKFDKPGEKHLLVDDDDTLSVVVGDNEGVDVVGSVAFKTLDGKPTKVHVWWGVMDWHKDGEKPYNTRLGVSAELSEGHLQTTFKGSIPKGTGPGRSMRLRLYFRMSAPGVVTAVQVSGWKM